jgi:ferritin-like metal-binding protein YciE
LKSWAKQLALEEAVSLLDETLQEERSAEDRLSQIAAQLADPEAEQVTAGGREGSPGANPPAPKHSAQT